MQIKLHPMIPYFRSKGFTLYHGDTMHLLEKLPAQSVDMVFSDPPYFINKESWDKRLGVKTEHTFHYNWLKACRRVLKPNGTIWVCGMLRSIHQCGLILDELGYRQLSTIVWFKPNMGEYLSRRYLISDHETIIWAARSHESRWIYNHNLMRDWWKNYRKQTVCPNCGTKHDLDLIHKPGKQMGSVWAIPKTPPWEKTFGKHPTQKPYDLLLRIIHASTRKGDVVLDPFCGTGTTGLAAAKHGRSFLGIDFTKDYLDIAVRRFRHFKTSRKRPYSLTSQTKQGENQ